VLHVARITTGAALPLGLAILAACSSPTEPESIDGVTFVALEASVVAGETIPLRIVNTRSESLIFGDCHALWLQVREGSTWGRRISLVPSDAVCLAILELIPAGGHHDIQLPIDLAMAPGTYRLVVGVRGDGRLVNLASTGFAVRGALIAVQGR